MKVLHKEDLGHNEGRLVLTLSEDRAAAAAEQSHKDRHDIDA